MSEDDLTNVVANRSVYASFRATKNKYTIKFVNWDSSELQSEEIEYGETPTYKGATPTKSSTNEDSFLFVGWSPSITLVTGNEVYVAQFRSSKNQYVVTFYSEDGNTELDKVVVNYGATAVYTNKLPTKEATAEYTYTFAKWVTAIGGETEDNLTNVVADREVYASFKATKNKYTIKFTNDDGDELHVYFQSENFR